MPSTADLTANIWHMPAPTAATVIPPVAIMTISLKNSTLARRLSCRAHHYRERRHGNQGRDPPQAATTMSFLHNPRYLLLPLPVIVRLAEPWLDVFNRVILTKRILSCQRVFKDSFLMRRNTIMKPRALSKAERAKTDEELWRNKWPCL